MSAYFLEHHQRFKCDANNIEASLLCLGNLPLLNLGLVIILQKPLFNHAISRVMITLLL